jgi:hypothetical protein
MMKELICISIIIALVLVTGCVNSGSYTPGASDTHANITAYVVKERSLLSERSLTFTCYLIDSNDVVYKVKYEADCIRFRSGANYTITQNYDQYIVYAEKRL